MVHPKTSTKSSGSSTSAIIVATYYNYYNGNGSGSGGGNGLKGCTMRFEMKYGSAFGIRGVNKGACPEDMQKLQLQPQRSSGSSTSGTIAYEKGSSSVGQRERESYARRGVRCPPA